MPLGAPDASGRRRPEPAPGTEFTIPCDRVLLAIGQGPDLTWIGPGSRGRQGDASKRRLKADAVTFETGRPGVFGTGDVRIGAATVVQAIAEGRRAAYAVDAFLKGNDLAAIRTRQTLAEPQPEFLSIVPFTGEVKEPRYRLKAMEAEERNHSYIEYEIPYTREEAVAESTRCLQCTCEAIGFCDLRRLGIEYGTTLKTLEPQLPPGRRLPLGDREPVHRHQPRLRPRRLATRSSCASRRAASTAAAAPTSAPRSSGAACYDFMRIGFDTLVTTPLDMSLNDTPCVSCGRCAETCPTGALMPKPRVLQKYEVDESRCILCGICVDACPYDALRDGGEFELAHTQPRGADDRPHGARRGRPRDRGHVHPHASATGRQRAAAEGRHPRRAPADAPPVLPRARRRAAATATGTATTATAMAARRPAATAHAARSPTIGLRSRLIAIGAAWRSATIPLFVLIRTGTTPVRGPRRRSCSASALLVVTMRDIIRCGLAMIVCFGALAGLYVLAGAPLVAAAQVLVYIGAISVLVLFAIMLTQTKAAPAGSSSRPRPCPAAIAAVVLALADRRGRRGHGLGRARHARRDRHAPTLARRCSPTYVLAVRGRRACCCSRRSSAACSSPSASTGRRLMLASTAIAASTPTSSSPASCSRSARSASSPGATRSAC